MSTVPQGLPISADLVHSVVKILLLDILPSQLTYWIFCCAHCDFKSGNSLRYVSNGVCSSSFIQQAFSILQDRDSNLTVPARWEDRNLRNYLNNTGIGNYL